MNEEKKLNQHSKGENLLFWYQKHIFGQLLEKNNCHKSLAVRAFDMIARLRARPRYQLSSGTKLTGESALYLAWLGFLSPANTFGYAQLW